MLIAAAGHDTAILTQQINHGDSALYAIKNTP